MRRAVAIALTLLAAGCGAGAVPHPTDQHVARVRVRWPDTTRASLARGRELYVARCSGCHPLRAPGEYDADSWAVMVDKMAPRAHLSAGEQDLVLRYLTAAAAAPSR